MKNNKKYQIIAAILVIVTVLGILIVFKAGEDEWTKNKQGIYIKHGNPSKTPDYVLEQQQLILESTQLCFEKKQEFLENNEQLESQCLGTIRDYAVDIVNNPRNPEIDDLTENQCAAYRQKQVSHFIELDRNCMIVRIV